MFSVESERPRRFAASPKNKQLLAACFCVLLCLPNVADGRKVTLSRVTKPTAHRGGYANADIAKLSYSPSHAAPPPVAAKPAAPVYSAPPAQHGAAPSYGWNVPGAHPGAPAAGGGVYPGAAVAGAAGSGIVAGNVYRSHGHNSTGGFGSLAHSPPVAAGSYPGQAPVQGFPGAPVQHPGGGFPAPGYQPQPAGGYYPQSQQGFPHQPSYAPAGHYDQGHYQGHPGQTVHHYEQPASGGSGIGTILGAGAAGLAAGVGGAALYDALKPKESKDEGTTTTATTAATTVAGASTLAAASETPAPVSPANPNGEAPLAPLPVNPNGDAPLAPMPTSPNGAAAEVSSVTPEITPLAADSTTVDHSPENPLGMAPLAPLPDSSSAASTDSTTTATTGSDVEARSSALNVQPDLSASMTEPAKGGATERAHLTSAFSLVATLLPLIVKYLRC
ncbi:uncharacterized protein D806_0078-like [Anopheles bellator]|uniref:uncharacterized protein D806_0078-like n=1 Tax=Anopheles bellator TaxID=139047 RepID=UPI0026496413|nr:uncharacterized protein D806_0078-like [Anopheles bellator]XP_058057572.1 uncharacterized protein D806_0078-like [Anopheles bellator]